MKKKVYCFGLGLHTYIKTLVNNPPKGYEFITIQPADKINRLNKIKSNPFIVFFYKKIFKKLFNVFYIVNRTYYEPSPEDSDLIFSHGQIVYEEKPWVVEILDSPISFAGYDYRIFNKNLVKIEEILSSKWCKKIIVHFPDMKKEFETYFSEKVINKITILPPALPENKIENHRKNKNQINFLFMGSLNNPDDFYIKGGLYALETFKKLSEKYNNIHLFFRCKLPENIKKKYALKSITFLDSELPFEKIKELYLQSDIFLFPGHFYFLMATLEAMSYGLPFISLDRYGVSAFIEDCKNGFLIPPSKKVPYSPANTPYLNAKSNRLLEHFKAIDEEVINNLYEKASILVENKKLREKMGAESIQISKDKLNLKKRNKHLKRIFDEALKN